MAIELTVETGIPLPSPRQKGLDPESLVQKTAAAAATARLLAQNGLEIAPRHEDEEIAGSILAAFAEDPEKASKEVTPKKLSTMRPAALIEADKILSTYGQQVVDNSILIRHLVTNKLIIESDHDDPKVRLKALEMLGKISDVGLFAEKSEITITHQTTEELRDTLRHKLNKLLEKKERDITPVNTGGAVLNPELPDIDTIELTSYEDIEDDDSDDVLTSAIDIGDEDDGYDD